MVALRLFALLLLVASVALPARADVFPYEAENAYGRNNIPDSNAASCDSTEGCYNRTGARCSAAPGVQCDLQRIPAGRCTTGNLATGLASCVWPHGAGRCASNTKVGCLSDAYVANPASTASGPSTMCSSLATNTCDMATDPFGGAFRAACVCQGTDPVAAAFETVICGGGGSIPVCSDGDPLRDVGGWGTALGVELITGLPGSQSFATMGPITTGDIQANSTPYYAIENPPTVFDPQRSPGSVGRTNSGAIQGARTTDAREISNFLPALGVRKLQSYGDSYWNDWAFATVQTTGTFNTHIVTFACNPPGGWRTELPVAGASTFCSQASRDSISFVWSRDLTPTELTNNPTCPPNCKKDFDLTSYELEAFIAAGLLDPDAGAQLAIQSGEGRQAGAGDSLGVAIVTSMTWLTDGDMRCRLGGWGNPAGQAGRCSDSPGSCDLALVPDICPGTESCRACNGPYNATTNALGLPIGYSTRGRTELDLVTRQRIGGIAGNAADVKVVLFVVGTTGYAGSDFRDIPAQGGAGDTADLANLGQVAVGGGAPVPATGIGAGGTFTNPSVLPIGEDCCANGANIVWAPEAGGVPVDEEAFRTGGFLRTYDVGPGPNGIPGCIGDNPAASNGFAACNQRLGQGTEGPKSDGFFATGQDDVIVEYPIGPNTVPASANRFQARDASAATTNYFSTTYDTTSNPPTVNTIAAFTIRDITLLLIPRNTDVLVKVNTTQCPIIGGESACSTGTPVGCGPGEDTDGDLVCNATDNCPTIANADQADPDGDAVGTLCDNCTARANARVAAGFLTTNTWATLTGDQRDDDHDGFGNRCDADFTPTGALVGPADLLQFRAPSASGKSRTGDTCGLAPLSTTRPCAVFDLDEAGLLIGPGDLAQYRLLSGKVAGPRCATCPLTCTAGTTGNCF